MSPVPTKNSTAIAVLFFVGAKGFEPMTLCL